MIEFKRKNNQFVFKSEFPTLAISNEPFSQLFLNSIQKYAIEDPNRSAIVFFYRKKKNFLFLD